MTTKHPPEPWRVNPDSTDEVWAGDEPLFAVNAGSDLELDEATAARIVACINGCAGINPEAVPDLLAALEALIGPMEGVVEDGASLTAVESGYLGSTPADRTERTALLSRWIREHAEAVEIGVAQARAAITRAKGE